MSHNKAKREARKRRAETGEPYARAHRIAQEQALQPSPAEAAVSVLDEAARLHRAAGVDYHTAHDAYIYAVADTVKAMGIEISEVTADAGEPREGWFRLGPPMEELWDDETGYGPSRVVGWREDQGWHYVYFSDSQKSGDWVEDLDAALGMTARPENVAVAVARLAGELPRAPLPWALPGGYDEYPDLPDDGEEVWACHGPRAGRLLLAFRGFGHVRPLGPLG
jgi:hypothetical protein